jgi:hypothetical protein
MPMEPDIVIWRALLSACKTYKKPALGEIAMQIYPDSEVETMCCCLISIAL